MSLNLSKTFLTFSVSMLLVAASLTPSDADRMPNGKLQLKASPPPTIRNVAGISSCFSRSTGIPDQYACSSHGG